MDARRTMIIAGASGVLVPIIIQLMWMMLNLTGLRSSQKLGYFASVLSLMVWPSGYFMAVAPDYWGVEYVFFLAISITVNVLIYCALGFAIWFSFNKALPLLGVLAALILSYWVLVLSV